MAVVAASSLSSSAAEIPNWAEYCWICGNTRGITEHRFWSNQSKVEIFFPMIYESVACNCSLLFMDFNFVYYYYIDWIMFH